MNIRVFCSPKPKGNISVRFAMVIKEKQAKSVVEMKIFLSPLGTR